MPGEITAGLRRAVAERAYHVCGYCLVHEEDAYHGCEADHIISQKHGGATELMNLALACFHCNRHKGTDSSARGHGGSLVRRFHPRTDHWTEHFQTEEGRITGLSEMGRATARLLDFNHPERVALRRLRADIGRYPTIEALARMRG